MRTRETGFLNPLRNLVAIFNCLMVGYRQDITRLFSEMQSTRRRHSRSLQQQEKFCLGIRRTVFTMKVEKHWNRLPRKVMESPSSGIFKI